MEGRHHSFVIDKTDLILPLIQRVEVVKRFKKYVRKPHFTKIGLIVAGYLGNHNKNCSEYDWHYLLRFFMQLKTFFMKIRFFKYGVGNGWEVNFIGHRYNLRIARHQLAFWKNYEPIFNISF